MASERGLPFVVARSPCGFHLRRWQRVRPRCCARRGARFVRQRCERCQDSECGEEKIHQAGKALRREVVPVRRNHPRLFNCIRVEADGSRELPGCIGDADLEAAKTTSTAKRPADGRYSRRHAGADGSCDPSVEVSLDGRTGGNELDRLDPLARLPSSRATRGSVSSIWLCRANLFGGASVAFCGRDALRGGSRISSIIQSGGDLLGAHDCRHRVTLALTSAGSRSRRKREANS